MEAFWSDMEKVTTTAGEHRASQPWIRAWLGTRNPVTEGGGQYIDARTQSQEEGIETQILGPSHKRRMSGHRYCDPATRGGGQDTDTVTQPQGEEPQEEEVKTQMLGPSHKRRRSGHRYCDPVTRGGGQDTDAGTQSPEEESSNAVTAEAEVASVVSEEVQLQQKGYQGAPHE
ncbi:hypothetical protein MAR_005803 [Mya arenaria]|uniref:Uncharacterized protein n=1 Tax=Mya arenaria TaxID=6604 RepID=A0ABY7F4R8_MYAAR|nr:hypothetical protein MAR_005803 [Mya arenaria]